MYKALALLPFMLFSSLTLANDFEASLSSETAQFSLYSDSSVVGWGGSDLALRLLYNEAGDFVGQAEIMSIRQADENTPLTLGVGVKGYLGRLDILNESVFAVAIGGSIRYVVPAKMPFTLYANLFLAPKITSFSDTKELQDYNFGAQIEIMPQTAMFVGYRKFKIDTKKASDYRLDDSNIHFGIRLTF